MKISNIFFQLFLMASPILLLIFEISIKEINWKIINKVKRRWRITEVVIRSMCNVAKSLLVLFSLLYFLILLPIWLIINFDFKMPDSQYFLNITPLGNVMVIVCTAVLFFALHWLPECVKMLGDYHYNKKYENGNKDTDRWKMDTYTYINENLIFTGVNCDIEPQYGKLLKINDTIYFPYFIDSQEKFFSAYEVKISNATVNIGDSPRCPCCKGTNFTFLKFTLFHKKIYQCFQCSAKIQYTTNQEEIVTTKLLSAPIIYNG